MNLSLLVRQLKAVVGPDGVLDAPEEVMLYEYDAGLSKGTPSLVVFPTTTEHVSRIMRVAHQAGISVVARGAGTGLSGGSISRDRGIILCFSRMNKVLELDIANQRAVVQPGVVNTDLSAAVAAQGLHFAPDPSSARASTIGGNVAENSGGPHTLAYGVTVNHVTGLEVVFSDGRVAEFGGKANESLGYDVTGFLVGAEGTLAIATKITVKLTRKSEAWATLLGIFNSMDDAANSVVAITGEGITPTALEMLDGWALRTVEQVVHAGYPVDCAAVLLIELEGLKEAVEEQAEAVWRVCTAHNAREVRRARDQRERDLLWLGRKSAFGAIGRISPSYYTQDGVVPRTKIPQTLKKIAQVSEKWGLRIFNIFHAGDGNLHPAILFDVRDPEQTSRAHGAAKEVMQACIDAGGTLTGEHGIGMEKNELMPMLFNEDDLEVMSRLRQALDPKWVLNPNKIFPTPSACRETRVVSRVPLPEGQA
jgi:glycolate oxidase